MGIVLADIEEDSGVLLSRSVDFSLTLSCLGLIKTESDHSGNPRLYGAVQPYAQNIGPCTEHSHRRPPEDDPSCGVSDLSELCFICRSEFLGRLKGLDRHRGKPSWRCQVAKS